MAGQGFSPTYPADLIIPTAEETPEKTVENSTPLSSDIDEKVPDLTHAQKLKKMHKAVTQILKKTKKTKEHLKFLRQEVEVTCEELKNETIEDKHQSEILDLSEISSRETNNVWDEVKNLELQVKMLKEKVKTGEESIKYRKTQGEEIKELIFELENLQNSRDSSRSCGCKACLII